MATEKGRSNFQTGEILTCDVTKESFKVEEKLGEGKCAVVYKAYDSKKKRKVALKVYNAGNRYNGAFQRELSVLHTLKSLRDPHALQWFGQFVSMSHKCITMELLDFSIRHILYKNNKKGLGLWGVQKFAKDIIRGLIFLHSENLVHGDLKPANIFWSSQHGCFKIFDFGLSFHLSEKNVHQIQSLGYQSPEVQVWNAYKQKPTTACDTINESDAGHRCACHAYIYCSTHESHSSDQVPRNSSTNIFHCNYPHHHPPDCGTSIAGVGDCNQAPFTDICSNCCCRVGECRPVAPRKPSDLWSVGCLIMEMATGQKFLKDRHTDLNNSSNYQLYIFSMIDKKLREGYSCQEDSLTTFARYQILRDLLQRCCNVDPRTRLTAESLYNHSFLQSKLEPSLEECKLFPTTVLSIMNVGDSSQLNNSIYQDTLAKILATCRKIGLVLSCYVEKKGTFENSILVKFADSNDCRLACEKLNGITHNHRTLVTTYCPMELYTPASET